MSLHPEVLLASGYALVLLGVARGLVALGHRAREGEDTWPRWEAARFHQGLAAVLVSLASVLLVACAVRHPEEAALGVLGLAALPVAAVARRTWVDWKTGAPARGEE